MNKYELVKKIESFAPLETQETWDYSGWIVETAHNEVKKVMLALTVNETVFAQAEKNQCDMIISHHPLFFIPIEYGTKDIYSAHTNMDKADGGTTDMLIAKLGLQPTEKCGEFVRVVRLETPVSVTEFKDELKNISQCIRTVNNKSRKLIHSIGFCAGSGAEFIDCTNVDAFVTGDVKYHCAVDSDKVIFDIGHFESEVFVLEKFKELLGIEVIIADEKTPFIM